VSGAVTVPATSRYSRVTLVGARRRIDLVLPSTEPVGSLLPDLLVMVGDEAASPPRARQLVGSDGEVLAPDVTLAEAQVRDGAVLRLVARHDVPPAPVVHDVIEEVSDDTDARAWRWGPVARRWTVTCGVVAGCLLLAWMLARAAPSAPLAADALIVAAFGLLAGGIVAGRMREPAGTALTLGGGAVALAASWTATGVAGWQQHARLVTAAAVLAAATVLLGLTSPLGRVGVVGGGLALALAAAWGAGAAAALPPQRLAAVMAVASVVLLGLLPRVALTASGLTALDDRRTAGAEIGRQDAVAAVDGAHRSLSIATVATAASSALAGVLLAGAPSRWTVPLALALTVVLASRARVFPLVAEVAALLAAAGAVLAALLGLWLDRSGLAGPVAAVLTLVAVGLVVIAVEFPEHVRARFRRHGDRLEAVAVLAVVPLAIGVFGIYGRLLATF
jgi:type VII secretion integral membrane protein EccD